jgi:hypothetical protein
MFTYHVEGTPGDGHDAEISYHLDQEEIPSQPEVEANARLMSAAPELLEVLKDYMAEDHCVVGKKEKCIACTYCKALLAVKRAEGPKDEA